MCLQIKLRMKEVHVEFENKYLSLKWWIYLEKRKKSKTEF